MSRTPLHMLNALDQITAEFLDPRSVGEPEALGFSPVAQLQLQRTRTVFRDENVVGAGIAEKFSQGKPTGELGLAIYVKRKLDSGALEPEMRIPAVLAGPRGRAIFTDVVEVGEIVPESPEPNASPPPLRSGFSICHADSTAGTLGAFVRKDGNIFCLSNAHVFALSGLAAIGDTILFPGPTDNGKDPADRCGTLAEFAPLSPGGAFVNRVDAALASIAPELLPTINPAILGAATPLKAATPQRDMRVIKRGRTTGDTESVVRDTDFRIQINYPGVGLIGFTGQVRCDRYTEGGDSGSIVVDKDSGAIVGLHFAGSPGLHSVFTPIKTVMEALQFRF